MKQPNQYTLEEPDGMYGLHRFKDGALFLCKQHKSGSWITIRPATKFEEDTFRKKGTRSK
jgi:hypothetical protein